MSLTLVFVTYASLFRAFNRFNNKTVGLYQKFSHQSTHSGSTSRVRTSRFDWSFPDRIYICSIIKTKSIELWISQLNIKIVLTFLISTSHMFGALKVVRFDSSVKPCVCRQIAVTNERKVNIIQSTIAVMQCIAIEKRKCCYFIHFIFAPIFQSPTDWLKLYTYTIWDRISKVTISH